MGKLFSECLYMNNVVVKFYSEVYQLTRTRARDKKRKDQTHKKRERKKTGLGK